ncbi:MAG: AAA family ATPase [Xanthobacteraceae bacterium]
MRFGIENFLSIRDYQELSLVASSLKEDTDQLIEVSGLSEKLLPAVLIYGANASGKSNVLAAIDFLRWNILYSQRKASPSGGISRPSFALDRSCKERLTKVDCDVIIAGVRYHFGFSVTDNEFIEEWLYAFPNGKRQLWYQREAGTFVFGKSLKGKNKAIQELTRPNSLFISSAAQNAHEQLLDIYSFFDKDLQQERRLPVSKVDWSSADREKIVDFLRSSDVGIKSMKVDEVSASEEVSQFMSKLDKLIGEVVTDLPEGIINDTTSHKLTLGHASDEGETFLDMSLESKGTRRLLVLIDPILRLLSTGGIFILDEIESSLHPLVSRQIVRLFTNKRTNEKGAQLIAATHDTNLLRPGLLRRDQIWFTEKDRSGATHLYPLSDIHTRRGDNLEKGYLQGRFGAIPFIDTIEDIASG